MSVWVEIHCDMPLDKAAKECVAFDANYPGALARSVVPAHDAAMSEAHKRGWSKRSGEWFCPACAKVKL